MQKIHDFNDVHRVLSGYVPRAHEPGNYTLERIKDILEVLDNPQNKFKTVHVAGTSGKTSTCYYISALLSEAGKKVGLTVSPHVDEVNERVQINGVPMPEDRFCSQLSEFIDIIDSHNLKPTYFELLVAFAYWFFAKEKVDYAVVEVGLGGLLDGTNVITRPDKVCVITDIGLDHTNVLGNTIAEIAEQKAGIIQSHNAVFCYRQDTATMSAIKDRCAQMHAQLHEVRGTGADPRFLPPFQKRNWHLAQTVFDYIRSRDDLPTLSAEELETTAHTLIPARMEVIKYKGKTLIIDGSHNGPKMKALVEGIKALYPGQKASVIVSFVDSKFERATPALEQLLPIASALIVTSFSGEQDTPKYSVDPEVIAGAARSIGFKSATIKHRPKDALELLMQQPEEVLVVTGSFYLLNHIRPLVSKKGI